MKVYTSIIIILSITQIIYGFNALNNNQYLILNKQNRKIKLGNDKELINNIEIMDNIKNKQIITLAPGGIYGFYNVGTCYYLRQNYNFDDYIYSGVSAGAWNALFLSYKGDIKELLQYTVNDVITTTKNLHEVQLKLKKILLEKYTEDDFELEKLFISVTVFEKYLLQNNIYTDFENLEDAIDCCIASSNIPFITGNLILYYKKYLSIDGGFVNNIYLTLKKPSFHIHKNVWGKNYNLYNTFSFNNLYKLLLDGYYDAVVHKNFLDQIFINKK